MKQYPHQLTLRDEEAKIDYVVHAMRPITREEAVLAMKAFRASKQGRKVKPGMRYDIFSLYE